MSLGLQFPQQTGKRKELDNRLILIGNGFDLGHGLKTSFEDFYLDYLANAINTFYSKNKYIDELLEIGFKNSNYQNPHHRIITVSPSEALKELEALKITPSTYVIFSSKILNTINDSISDKKWVNIEALYFSVLLMIMKSTPEKDWSKAIGNLNKELDYIEKLLVAYLLKIENSFKFDNSNIKLLLDLFTEDFLIQDFATLKLKGEYRPKGILFLNFNYTEILSNYIERCKQITYTDINYIHGRIKEVEQNPIIFGFGDEHDKKYLDFEEKNNNVLFEHIKSFKYLRTDNYYNLLRFIDSNLFQVQIYGHSCGVTDRTMLNHIFEHENCKSIKVFYHQKEDGTNDFTDKTYEISRHFNDKGLMRKKLVPFNLSQPMPQPVEFKNQNKHNC
jgi:hypothetical protein